MFWFHFENMLPDQDAGPKFELNYLCGSTFVLSFSLAIFGSFMTVLLQIVSYLN